MVQRLKTAPVIDAADLPDLTPQQMAFVQGIVSGKSATDAYRAAYNCSDWLPSSIWVNASKLRSDANVALWLAAARKACLGDATLTLEQHQQQLERLREIALESGNIGAAVQAELGRGKAAGLHIDRVQEVPADPIQTLKDIAQHQPDLAASLAAQHGIPWADHAATKH